METTGIPKVLVIGHSDRDLDFSNVYRTLSSEPGYTVHATSKAELKKFRSMIKKFQPEQYDRTIIDLPFSKTHKQSDYLSQIPGLILFEEDACQNFLAGSRWQQAFSRFYSQLPNATLIVTGYGTAERFRREGFKPEVIPKGFDQSKLKNLTQARDIELGFIGRIQSEVYKGRRQLLDTIAKELPLQILRTSSLEEYCQTLNRIQFFLSADVGLGEYMAKNFEAMACGCVVFAYRQGNGEEEALGLKDMENIVLYRTPRDVADKIRHLKSNPEQAARIARQGERHALERFSHEHIARQITKIAAKPVSTFPTPKKKPSIITRIFRR